MRFLLQLFQARPDQLCWAGKALWAVVDQGCLLLLYGLLPACKQKTTQKELEGDGMFGRVLPQRVGSEMSLELGQLAYKLRKRGGSDGQVVTHSVDRNVTFNLRMEAATAVISDYFANQRETVSSTSMALIAKP